MSAESPPAPDYLRPPQGEADWLHTEFDQQPESLFDQRKDTVINLYGMEGTIGDLIEFCPIDPSQMSEQAKDTFVAKALHASGEEVPEAYQHMVPELAEKIQANKQTEKHQGDATAKQQPEEMAVSAAETQAPDRSRQESQSLRQNIVTSIVSEPEAEASPPIDVVAMDLLQARLEAQKLLEADNQSAESSKVEQPKVVTADTLTTVTASGPAEQTSSHKKQVFTTKLTSFKTLIEQFTKPVVEQQRPQPIDTERISTIPNVESMGTDISTEPEVLETAQMEVPEVPSVMSEQDVDPSPQLFGEDSVIEFRHFDELLSDTLSLPEPAEVDIDASLAFEPLQLDSLDDLPELANRVLFDQLAAGAELSLNEFAEGEFWQAMMLDEAINPLDEESPSELGETLILNTEVDQPFIELVPPVVQERMAAFEAVAEPEEAIVLQSLTIFVESAAKNLQEVQISADATNEQIIEAQAAVEQLYDELLQHIGIDNPQERRELIEQFMQSLEAQSKELDTAENAPLLDESAQTLFDFKRGTREYKRSAGSLTKAVRRLSHKITRALGRHAVAPLKAQPQS